MPQVFQVLRCYKCLTFQVHQTKKSKKWECKLCSEKQSVKRHYGIGIAKDCRLHVQKLNSMRGEIDELKCGQMQRNSQSDEEGDETEIDILESAQAVSQKKPVSSKWSDYLEAPETVDKEKDESMYLGDAEVVFEIPKKQGKQSSKYCNSNRNTASTTSNVSHSTEYGTYHKAKVLVPLNHSNVKEIKELHSDNSSYQTRSVQCNENIPCVGNKQSKWADYIDDEDSDLKPSTIVNVSQYSDNPYQTPSVQCNENIPPVVNKQSKWAEYIDDEDSDLKPSTIVNVSQCHTNIFSLCDDTDLDDVLNI